MNQLIFITNHLKEHNEISRNYCLRNYISRLGAYIVKLKKQGWDFRTEKRDGDYVYIVTKSPAPYVKREGMRQGQLLSGLVTHIN